MYEIKNDDLVQLIQELGPEWNDFDVELFDPATDEELAETKKPYTTVEEHYILGHPAVPAELIHKSEVVNVFNGILPMGESWHPLSIKLYVDGHSYTTKEQKACWPEAFECIKNRILYLTNSGYVISRCKGLKNQKSPFPGGIDADESFDHQGRSPKKE